MGGNASRADARVGAGAFLRALAALKRQLGESLVLTFALGLTEWVGLLLLVPLLALVGLRDRSGEVSRIAEHVATLLEAAGVNPTLPAVLGLFLALVTARAFLQRREAIATTALEQEFVLRLRKRLYSAISRTQWLYFVRQPPSDFTHALTSELDRVSLATSQLLQLVGQVGVGLAYVAIAVRISPAMSALAAAAGGSLVLVLRGWSAKARAAGERFREINAEVYSAVHEHLGGMKTARSYGAGERNAEHFFALAEQLSDATARASRSYGNSVALFAVGAAAVLGILVWISISMLSLPTTTVLLLLLVFSRLVPRFSSTLSAYQLFASALPSYGNIARLIADCEAQAEPHSSMALPPVLRGAVRFSDIRFRYLTDLDVRTLDDITIDVPARRTTAIVGASGAGKSTIADLILGLIAPESGTLLVDEEPLTPAVAQAWRTQIGYVPQDTFLLHDSVRANLLWAQPTATDAELQAALQQAQASEFVSRLPRGINTILGDRGVLLSGGERQRIALARALLRRPALLILDEATSALDSENEQRILQAIADLHGQTTILIITHRLSTIRDADVIHVLDEGRVVASGSWNGLLVGESSRFRDLCMAQGVLDRSGDPPRPSITHG